jgi:hypothetical protein
VISEKVPLYFMTQMILLMTFGDLFEGVGTLEADVIFSLSASKKQANWGLPFLVLYYLLDLMSYISIAYS